MQLQHVCTFSSSGQERIPTSVYHVNRISICLYLKARGGLHLGPSVPCLDDRRSKTRLPTMYTVIATHSRMHHECAEMMLARIFLFHLAMYWQMAMA